jgi:Protein of unknown function (DUF3455)
MNQLRSYRTILVAAVLLVLAHVLSLPLSVSARSGATPPSVPEIIAVPPPYVLLFRLHATGVQTYECQNGQWTFRAPRAVLFDPHTNRLTGIHYGGIDRGLTPGPWWEALGDGSSIRGGNAVSAPSPNPNSIPLLRLEVLERHGSGLFSQVSYIQRLNTLGGVGPVGVCSAGAQRWVPYTADYYFYGNP